ncbi:MAG: catalase [Ruminococcaceae bacterium]|nr:catalase [Oscillospiraceae bacterium]
MSFINGIRHFATITKHRHKVISHCRRAGIFWQGLRHDLSKYSPSEFLMGARYYIGTRSPNDGERADKGYSSAWMHHKGRNRHHFEYWTDYNPETRLMTPVKMPINYVKEMFCDRVAASKIYQKENYDPKHPLEYFMRGKAKRSIHPETSDLLEGWLKMLSEVGEDKTLKYIKNQKSY